MCRVLAVCVLLAAAGGCPADEGLPVVTDAPWKALRPHAANVLRGLKTAEAPLPGDTERALRKLLDAQEEPPQGVEQVQKLLDARCLIAIHINPESRVKAARGPANADLTRDRPVVLLVKVHNEAGITTALRVAGDEIRTDREQGKGRWLEAEVISAGPLSRTLSGDRVQYLPLRLTAREAGKREATLKFDAGQGTQDLGFRAEVPILFRIQ